MKRTVISFGSQLGVFAIADAVEADAAGAAFIVAIRLILQGSLKAAVLGIVLEVVPIHFIH